MPGDVADTAHVAHRHGFFHGAILVNVTVGVAPATLSPFLPVSRSPFLLSFHGGGSAFLNLLESSSTETFRSECHEIR